VRVLLDESLPHDLVPLLTGHDVETVQGRGWAGRKNGALLAAAEPDFDVFLTADRNISYQQNLTAFDLRVVVLAAPRNRIEDIRPLLPKLLQAIGTARPREATWVAP
jgi:hypothetical protein